VPWVNPTCGRLLPRRRSRVGTGTLTVCESPPSSPPPWPAFSQSACSPSALCSCGATAKKTSRATSPPPAIVTDTAALATDNLDLDLDGLDTVVNRDHYGTIRVQVDPRTDKPLFVGIAPTKDVERYLRGTSHTLVRDVSYGPFHADYANQPGTSRPAAPAAQSFWSASAHGAGRQTLTWDVDDGNWSVVVMNDDGSRGVDAGVRAGADVPWLSDLAWGGTIGGIVMLLIAAGFTVVAVRSKPRVAVPA
jgi:hypothetical protein